MSDTWRVNVGNSTYMQLYGELRTYFARRVGVGSDPSDFVMKVWVAAGRYYKGKSSLRHYLFVLARSILAEHYRKLGRQVDVAPGELGEVIGDLPNDDTGPESAAVRGDEQAALWHAVWRMREPLRQTMYLKLLDLDDTQIATVLGVSPHTVRSRLHRGRALLAKLMMTE